MTWTPQRNGRGREVAGGGKVNEPEAGKDGGNERELTGKSETEQRENRKPAVRHHRKPCRLTTPADSDDQPAHIRERQIQDEPEK